MLTDGVAEPESTFYPLYNVRQVEVLKGPAAFLYGGNPLAGAVQIVRKQPLARPLRARPRCSYGTLRDLRGHAGRQRRHRRREARLPPQRRLAGRRTATATCGDGAHRAPSIPTLAWRPDDGHARGASSFEYVRSDWPPDSGLPFVGDRVDAGRRAARARPTSRRFDRSEQDVYRAAASTPSASSADR